jgi:carbonic anhydrase
MKSHIQKRINTKFIHVRLEHQQQHYTIYFNLYSCNIIKMMSRRFINVEIVFIIFITTSQICISDESEWNYESEGPDTWPHEYASCRGRLQSPINLEPTYAKYNPNLKPITFTNYNISLRWDVKNNGHTSKLNKKLVF